MQNELKTCAFCGQTLTSKTKAREHVWPSWLQNRLGVEKQQFQGIHTGIPRGIHTISTRTQSTNSLVLGGICATCNNGWMSELETKVAPLFERLWDTNSDKYIELDLQSCETIAHWAFKTSLVINLASNYRKIVPSEHFRELYEHKRLPINTAVDISLAPFAKNLQWTQGQSAIGTISVNIEVTEYLAKIISTLYVITLDVAGILLRTVWIPTNFLEVSLPNTSNIKRIWPFTKPAKLSLIKRKNEMGKFHISAQFRTKKKT